MPARIQSILRLEVPLIVQIAQRTMPVDEVLSMAPGAIIELPKSADDDLEIMVNNKTIGTGTAVKVGENYGVRVSFIGDLQQRIDAMGPDGPGEVAADGEDSTSAASEEDVVSADQEPDDPGNVETA